MRILSTGRILWGDRPITRRVVRQTTAGSGGETDFRAPKQPKWDDNRARTARTLEDTGEPGGGVRFRFSSYP